MVRLRLFRADSFIVPSVLSNCLIELMHATLIHSNNPTAVTSATLAAEHNDDAASKFRSTDMSSWKSSPGS